MTSLIDGPPPTYEESLGHRLARDDRITIQETSFVQNTISTQHSVNPDLTRSENDPDRWESAFELNNISDPEPICEIINEAFDEDDVGVIPIHPDESRDHTYNGNQTCESQRSRSLENVLSRSSASLNDDCLDPSSKNVNSCEREYSQSEMRSQNGQRKRQTRERLSKSYDDILSTKIFRLSTKRSDPEDEILERNTPGTSKRRRDPDENITRRRTRSETHLLWTNDMDVTYVTDVTDANRWRVRANSRETSV